MSSFNVAGCIKEILKDNIEMPYDEAIVAYKLAGGPKSREPDKQRFFNIKSDLRKKLKEEESPAPKSRGGSGIDITRRRGFCVMQLRRVNDMSYEEVENLWNASPHADDNPPMTKQHWYDARSTVQKEALKSKKAEDSLDPNQNSGPRAGAGKRKSNKESDEVRALKQGIYEEVERQLEEVMQVCDEMQDGELVTAIRKARRRASAKIIQYED